MHVGSGFRPWRRGGLVAYIEDLMREQVRQGHEVAYFFSGRQYPLAGRPWLRQWKNGEIGMYEVVNSPLFDHGHQPDLEVHEPRVDAMFERLISDLRPEVVHVQELAGLPSSVLEVPGRIGVPTVFTLQDYFPLCSTFRLLDSDGQPCLRREVGADCVATTAADGKPPGLLIEATLGYDLMTTPVLGRIGSRRRRAGTRRVAKVLGTLEARRRHGRRGRSSSPELFQRRREVNLDRLNQTDCLIAMSTRVSEIYASLGIDSSRLRTVQLTLAHLERLEPQQRRCHPEREPIIFASLSAFESTAKGGRLLLEAVQILAELGLSERFRVLIFGHVDPGLAASATGLHELQIRGAFAPQHLNDLLEEVDVGIMPSIWEEAYGYAGIEFLAKGIPVIANALGGMPEYVRDGHTGWLNQSCSAHELANIMAGVIEHPTQLDELSENITSSRSSLVKPMKVHEAEIGAIYREVAAARRAKTVVN